MSGLRPVSVLRTSGVRLKRAIEAKMERRGLAYPWWIPIVSLGALVVSTVLALGQRDALLNPRPITLCLLLVLAPLAQFVVPPRLSIWIDVVAVVTASVWLLADPVPGPGMADVAPAVLMILATVAAARDGLAVGAVVTLVGLGVLAWAAAYKGLPTVAMYSLDVGLGFAVGYMLRSQMHALTEVRAARAGERRQAALAERQRIAREIHDLVAHSLSITLLHITGARQALKDDEGGHDGIAEADEALQDAEAIGRQAMADIRRTVSTLSEASAGPHPLPDAQDIGALIEQVRSAGLAVDYDESGDLGSLRDAAGLGLYRITQESLANVVKHAPGSPARVRLGVERSGVRLTISNPLIGRVRTDGSGHGVVGMRERAEQLGARIETGPRDRTWIVDVVVPAEQAAECPVPGLAKGVLP